jgi:hypothetical protein
MGAVREVVAPTAAMHGTIVRRHRHERQNLRVDVVRENPVEFQVKKRRLDRARFLDRLGDEIGKPLRCLAATKTGKARALIHFKHLLE